MNLLTLLLARLVFSSRSIRSSRFLKPWDDFRKLPGPSESPSLRPKTRLPYSKPPSSLMSNQSKPLIQTALFNDIAKPLETPVPTESDNSRSPIKELMKVFEKNDGKLTKRSFEVENKNGSPGDEKLKTESPKTTQEYERINSEDVSNVTIGENRLLPEPENVSKFVPSSEAPVSESGSSLSSRTQSPSSESINSSDSNDSEKGIIDQYPSSTIHPSNQSLPISRRLEPSFEKETGSEQISNAVVTKQPNLHLLFNEPPRVYGYYPSSNRW